MIDQIIVEPSELLEIGQEQAEIIVIHEALEIIEVGVLGPPGQKGDKGDAGSPATEISFSFGDASPLVLLTAAAGKTIERATVYIKTAFNGTSPTLRIGDAGQLDRIMSTNEVNPSEVATYQVSPGFAYESDTEIYLSINAGSGASQGSGLVVIEMQQ